MAIEDGWDQGWQVILDGNLSCGYLSVDIHQMWILDGDRRHHHI